MLHAVSAILALFSFWLVLSGFFTAFLISAGAASSLAVFAFSRRMGVVDLSWRALTYWPWLIKEIVKSSWDVSKIILNPRLPISPTLVRIKPTQRTPEGLVTHANSITLTPGTISVEVGPDEFLVHAVTREAAEGVASGDMDRRATRFEGSA